MRAGIALCCEAGLREAQMRLTDKWEITSTGCGVAERFAAEGKASRCGGAVLAADSSHRAQRLGGPEC
ncbi:hypothetical protein IC232_05070 [Microvirga sp. BT688]|uniref:hypothetical protein n=1 Tax=Microvirga sp. TaxID=1873136 RepID=UPI001686A42D|nr:hypothetical protein [Microvirga sp.]MBD2746069.1 hypothetical protein [Microvirga sp.]